MGALEVVVALLGDIEDDPGAVREPVEAQRAACSGLPTRVRRAVAYADLTRLASTVSMMP